MSAWLQPAMRQAGEAGVVRRCRCFLLASEPAAAPVPSLVPLPALAWVCCSQLPPGSPSVILRGSAPCLLGNSNLKTGDSVGGEPGVTCTGVSVRSKKDRAASLGAQTPSNTLLCHANVACKLEPPFAHQFPF